MHPKSSSPSAKPSVSSKGTGRRIANTTLVVLVAIFVISICTYITSYRQYQVLAKQNIASIQDAPYPDALSLENAHHEEEKFLETLVKARSRLPEVASTSFRRFTTEQLKDHAIQVKERLLVLAAQSNLDTIDVPELMHEIHFSETEMDSITSIDEAAEVLESAGKILGCIVANGIAMPINWKSVNFANTSSDSFDLNSPLPSRVEIFFDSVQPRRTADGVIFPFEFQIIADSTQFRYFLNSLTATIPWLSVRFLKVQNTRDPELIPKQVWYHKKLSKPIVNTVRHSNYFPDDHSFLTQLEWFREIPDPVILWDLWEDHTEPSSNDSPGLHGVPEPSLPDRPVARELVGPEILWITMRVERLVLSN